MLMVSTDSFFIRKADFDSWTIAFVFGAASTISLGLLFAATSDESPRAAFRRSPRALLTIAALASVSQIAFTAAVIRARAAGRPATAGSQHEYQSCKDNPSYFFHLLTSR